MIYLKIIYIDLVWEVWNGGDGVILISLVTEKDDLEGQVFQCQEGRWFILEGKGGFFNLFKGDFVMERRVLLGSFILDMVGRFFVLELFGRFVKNSILDL